jgi:hypothetical protein
LRRYVQVSLGKARIPHIVRWIFNTFQQEFSIEIPDKEADQIHSGKFGLDGDVGLLTANMNSAHSREGC